jgi:predicted transcriptional regulator
MALCLEDLKMNELSRKIDITPTEASRQTQRLLDEQLIEKQLEGKYRLSNFGKLVLHFFPSFTFISKNREYFLRHDVFQLPDQFISRVGELSKGKLCTEVADVVNGIEKLMQTAEDYVWVITDQVMTAQSKIMTEQVLRGVEFRSLFHEKLIQTDHLRVSGRYEKRSVSKIPGLFSITDKGAFVSFVTMDGKIDASGFFGSDSLFMKWARDLYEYCWKNPNSLRSS